MTRPFADRLVEATDTFGPLCVGIDPHPKMFPTLFGNANAGSIAIWADGIIQAAQGKVGIVKPQSALFELWGAAGIAALEHVCRTAREAGLLVILDAKRGDIGSTAKGYADAYLGTNAAIPCDALTVNPYLGMETLEPFIEAAAENGRGIAVLGRTSNPGSSDIQTKQVDGKPIYLHVAERLQEMSPKLAGANTHWSGLMIVAGATGPGEAKGLRFAAPDCPFLVPGYGAQGGGADDALAGFAKDQDDVLRGGIVNASRSVNFPESSKTAGTVEEWQAAIGAAIDEAQQDLKSASRRV